ncbi:MAG: IS1595 family transposase [Gaiellaceae bacterium]
MAGSPRKEKPDRYSVADFLAEYPDDDTCLEWLWRHLHSPDGHTADCPKCDKPRRFHRVKSRHSYSCDSCGHHIHPTAGTIFEKSTSSLRLWFHAVFLMSQTRCGISAKQLERELGVTYKTAWRMFNRIRKLLQEDEDEPPLGGEVEIDETAFGGRPKAGLRLTRQESALRREGHLTTIVGMVERGGRVRARVVPDRKHPTMRSIMRENVSPDATIYTDEWPPYIGLGRNYAAHYRIKHKDKIYADGHIHTQTIEGFFGNVKRGLSGVQHNVSRKWLQSYVDEFAFKYNHRDDGIPMFKLFLARVTKPA